MTNAEILTTECALHNVTEAVDTFAGWKRKGYSVKKGEHRHQYGSQAKRERRKTQPKRLMIRSRMLGCI